MLLRNLWTIRGFVQPRPSSFQSSDLSLVADLNSDCWFEEPESEKKYTSVSYQKLNNDDLMAGKMEGGTLKETCWALSLYNGLRRPP